MKKSERSLLSATLDKALAPPTPRRKPALASELAEYDDSPDSPAAEAAPAPRLAEIGPREPGSRGVTPPNPTLPVAPARDFNRRANSLERQALPAGIFPGSSKKLYDALYLRTRGAVVPKREVRATKRELSDWSGIRNVKTIDSHLRYFSAVGLLVSEWQRGDNEGALYEVFLPEETSGLFVRSRAVTPPDPTSPHLTPPDVGSPQNLGSPPYQNLGSPHLTEGFSNQSDSAGPKTSFKTKDQDIDDETAPLTEMFREMERELVGKTAASAEQWRELRDVLLAELRIAGARTTVSNVPAFLAEHLRRRLWKLDKKQAKEQGRELPDQVTTLAQGEAAPVECPDCKGSGWWYPDGQEKGVAKCRHSRVGPQPSS